MQSIERLKYFVGAIVELQPTVGGGAVGAGRGHRDDDIIGRAAGIDGERQGIDEGGGRRVVVAAARREIAAFQAHDKKALAHKGSGIGRIPYTPHLTLERPRCRGSSGRVESHNKLLLCVTGVLVIGKFRVYK